jgi:hypothetical protein
MLVSTRSASATCPLFDRIEHEGKSLVIPTDTVFPRSLEYSKWVSGLSRCSAGNQGRPRYRVDGNSIRLVEFYGCSSRAKPAEVYPGAAEQQPLAVWLNGEIVAYSSYCEPVPTPKITRFAIRRGIIVHIQE